MLLFVGSVGDTNNGACRHVLQRLFAASQEQLEEMEDDQWMLLGVLADGCRSGRRSTDDVVAWEQRLDGLD